MVELRKRKTPAEPVAPPPTKRANSAKSAAKPKDAPVETEAAPSNGNPSKNKVSVGENITLEGFGGEVETNEGEKTTLKMLLEESKRGVVLFTYPKASTPGCTTQACLFRDEFTPLTATGFSIYGLSTDSPKSNTTFKTKQKLPYTLLCDPSATLIAAIGMKKAPKGTTRGVFVIDKEGKVLAAEPGGPAATVEVVRKLVGEGGSAEAAASEDVGTMAEGSKVEDEIESGKLHAEEVESSAAANGDAEMKDATTAEIAADVADSAEKLDEGA